MKSPWEWMLRFLIFNNSPESLTHYMPTREKIPWAFLIDGGQQQIAYLYCDAALTHANFDPGNPSWQKQVL